MFESATLKLTGWYLLILMSISFLFSVIIYQVASSEIITRLEGLQVMIQRETSIIVPQNYDIRALRNDQIHEASINLIIGLIYANAFILITGGILSYVLARRTLRPIEEAHEAQSRFTSDASHELRTPLAVMKAELEVALRDQNLSKKDMREILDSNLEEVDKLTKLSHTLLQLSRLEYTALKKEPLALNALINEAVAPYRTYDRVFNLQLPKNTPYIDGHQTSIEELLVILIDNAVKYSPAGSVIELAVKSRSGKALLTITNSGVGIRPEDITHIFDRFYRADSSRTDSAKNGYGLGLSLAKQIVEIHHGELSASSAPDQATTFSVSLPLFTRNRIDANLTTRNDK